MPVQKHARLKSHEGPLRKFPILREHQVVSIDEHAALARMLDDEDDVLREIMKRHVLNDQRNVTPQVELSQ